jgi:hypothetical protein
LGAHRVRDQPDRRLRHLRAAREDAGAGRQLQHPRNDRLRPADGLHRDVLRGSGQPFRSHRRPAVLCLTSHGACRGFLGRLAAVDLARRFVRRRLEPRCRLRPRAMAGPRATCRACRGHQRARLRLHLDQHPRHSPNRRGEHRLHGTEDRPAARIRRDRPRLRRSGGADAARTACDERPVYRGLARGVRVHRLRRHDGSRGRSSRSAAIGALRDPDLGRLRARAVHIDPDRLRGHAARSRDVRAAACGRGHDVRGRLGRGRDCRDRGRRMCRCIRRIDDTRHAIAVRDVGSGAVAEANRACARPLSHTGRGDPYHGRCGARPCRIGILHLSREDHVDRARRGVCDHVRDAADTSQSREFAAGALQAARRRIVCDSGLVSLSRIPSEQLNAGTARRGLRTWNWSYRARLRAISLVHHSQIAGENLTDHSARYGDADRKSLPHRLIFICE